MLVDGSLKGSRFGSVQKIPDPDPGDPKLKTPDSEHWHCDYVALLRDQDDQATQWRLKLYPKGDTQEASGHLSVYLSNQTGH